MELRFRSPSKTVILRSETEESKPRSLALFRMTLVMISAVFFCGILSAKETDTSTSAPNADALAMLEERFASLSENMGKMTTLPKLSGTFSLPSEIHGKIQLPGDGAITQQPSKENET